ncbi:uncharacterized protein Dwil_GK19200 [Drosophila willistoni]|uniref:Uncharacterized protein n=1 Tax=Drosophila willistoni TaxID=7260 RepID=B4N9P3_DROWI|nr:uncharacterized protein LOC6646863 [Drosophila willistoni]EDW80608.2 uncharacterized protein Dwil_GK19200 [Drosophila willistoni]
MIRATTISLCIWLVFICFLIQQNHAATKVLYHFHIRDKHNTRNETGVLRQNNDEAKGTESPELIITGTRTSSFTVPDQHSNITWAYQETAVYTADNNGYHVKYNFSIKPVIIDTRLDAKTLKTLG